MIGCVVVDLWDRTRITVFLSFIYREKMHHYHFPTHWFFECSSISAVEIYTLCVARTNFLNKHVINSLIDIDLLQKTLWFFVAPAKKSHSNMQIPMCQDSFPLWLLTPSKPFNNTNTKKEKLTGLNYQGNDFIYHTLRNNSLWFYHLLVKCLL